MFGYQGSMLMGSNMRDYDYITPTVIDEPYVKYPKESVIQHPYIQKNIERKSWNLPQKPPPVKKPLQIIDQHIQVIANFDAIEFETLWQKIKALPLLVNVTNIPENKGNNLFYLIIFNADISEYNKNELLDILLYEKGYDKWGIQLFKSPFYQKLMDNRLSHEILENIYKRTLLNKNILDETVERNFLIQCMRYRESFPEDLWAIQYTQQKKLQLLTDWLNGQTRATDVIRCYERLQHKVLNMRPQDLQCFLKVAKQKILEIEINNRSSHHAGEDNERISDFLDRHRNSWTSCFSCFFTRSSMNIHNMIRHGNIAEASRAWQVEENSIHRTFHSRNNLK